MVDAEANGRPGAPALAALGDTELRRWHLLCRAMEGGDRHPWPEGEAKFLVDAVVSTLAGDDDVALDPATRAFARSTGSMPVLVRRLGCLRELFTEEGVLEGSQMAERLQRVLDKVTTLAMETALADLEDAALTDALTGVGNRRALETAARATLAASQRTGAPLSLAIIDLDGLKTINDTQGHAAGDKALAGMSASLRAALRDTDQLFRVGGDEFVALLPLAPTDTVAELMRRAERFNAPRFSWGAASAPADGSDLATLLQVADSRLYASRRSAGYFPSQRTGPAPASVDGAPPRRHGLVVAAVTALASVAAVVALVVAWPGSAKPSPAGHGGTPTTVGSQHGAPPTNGSPPSSSGVAGSGATSGSRPAGSSGTGSSSSSGTGSGSSSPGTGSSPAPTGGSGSGTGSNYGPPTTAPPSGGGSVGGVGNQPAPTVTLPPPPAGTNGVPPVG